MALALVLSLALACCGQSTASPAASSSSVTSGPSAAASVAASASGAIRPSALPPSAANPLPVLVDTDLAGDDLLALMVLLRDPAVDVRGVTIAATGEVHCVPGLRNSRRLLAAFGRPDIQVACGRETPGPNGRWFPPEWRAVADSLYGVELPAVADETARDETAPELLVRLAVASDAPLTLVTLGPMSNVADAAEIDPAFTSHLAGIHSMAGTIDAPGNISLGDTSPSDGVEWNVGADPDAMAAVLALDVPITLVGLDATDDVPVPADITARLGADHGAAGADTAYEMYVRTPFLADAGSSYWDPLAAVTLSDPSIAGWEDVTISMAASGPGAGHLSRDPGGRPVRAAMSADRDAFLARFLASLRRGAPRSQPFVVGGPMTVRWDGTTCRIEGDAPTAAGPTSVVLINDSGAPVDLLIGGVRAPKTWKDALAFIRAADLGDPGLVLPGWLLQAQGDVMTGAGSKASGFVTLPAGNLGAVCATGTFPDLEFFDAGPFSVGG